MSASTRFRGWKWALCRTLLHHGIRNKWLHVLPWCVCGTLRIWFCYWNISKVHGYIQYSNWSSFGPRHYIKNLANSFLKRVCAIAILWNPRHLTRDVSSLVSVRLTNVLNKWVIDVSRNCVPESLESYWNALNKSLEVSYFMLKRAAFPWKSCELVPFPASWAICCSVAHWRKQAEKGAADHTWHSESITKASVTKLHWEDLCAISLKWTLTDGNLFCSIRVKMKHLCCKINATSKNDWFRQVRLFLHI